MRINSISAITPKTVIKNSGLRENSTIPTETNQSDSVAFKGKPFTKFFGGISGITAGASIIATGGAGLLPILAYFAVCTGVGYAMDKENEADELEENTPENRKKLY